MVSSRHGCSRIGRSRYGHSRYGPFWEWSVQGMVTLGMVIQGLVVLGLVQVKPLVQSQKIIQNLLIPILGLKRKISLHNNFLFSRKFCEIQNCHENIGIPNLFAKILAKIKNFPESVRIHNIFTKTLTKIHVFQTVLRKLHFPNIVTSWLSCPGYLEADWFSLTCLCCPVPVVPSQMSCPRRPVLTCLSCPG
jgi:hypothetical protein